MYVIGLHMKAYTHEGLLYIVRYTIDWIRCWQEPQNGHRVTPDPWHKAFDTVLQEFLRKYNRLYMQQPLYKPTAK